MRLIDAEPIERALFRQADKALVKNPYANARVCAFRRAFELVLGAPTIDPSPSEAPPNDPLTLDELREMDGEPVWLKARGDDGHYVMFYGFENNRACFYREISRDAEEYGKTWLAYRRKPEGGDHVDR